MKKSGAAESIANFLFAFLGVKATVAGTLIITFLLAYGGVNAFIIIFAVYPVADLWLCPCSAKPMSQNS